MRKIILIAILWPLMAWTAVPSSVSRAIKQADEAASLEVECTLNGRLATLVTSGDFFRFDLGNAQVWYDGSNQWSYSPELKEVTIFKPTRQELAESNPLAILRSLESEFDGEAVKGLVNTVRMTPRDKRSNIAEATVTFNPTNGWPTALTIIMGSQRLEFRNFRFTPAKTKLPREAFIFNVKSDMQVTDLR